MRTFQATEQQVQKQLQKHHEGTMLWGKAVKFTVGLVSVGLSQRETIRRRAWEETMLRCLA